MNSHYNATPQLYTMEDQTTQLNTVTRNYNAHQQYERMMLDINARNIIQDLMRNNRYWAHPKPLQYSMSRQEVNLQSAPPELYHLANYLADNFDMHTWEILLALIATISSAISGVYTVKLSEQWVEPVQLYIVFAKSSGTRKSAMIKCLTESLSRSQDKNLKTTRNSGSLRSSLIETANKQSMLKAKQIVKKACNNPNFTSLQLSKLINGLASKTRQRLLEQVTAPSPKFISSFTGSSLEKLLESNNGALSIIGAEDPFIDSKIKFRSSTFPNLLLHGYDSEPYYKVNGRGKEIYIDRASISILAAMTPEVLLNYYDKTHLLENGFLNRLLPCFMCESPKYHAIPQKEHEQLLTDFNHRVLTISKQAPNVSLNSDRVELTLSHEAMDLIKSYQENIESRYGYPSFLQGFISKLHGKTIRIAACLHIWGHKNPWDHKISASDVDTAIALCEALIPHAYMAFDTEGRKNYANARRIIEWINKHRLSMVTTSDIDQGLNNLGKNISLPALNLLSSLDYVQELKLQNYKPMWIVNPNICLNLSI